MSDAGDDEEEHEAAEKCLEIAPSTSATSRRKADHGAVDFGDLIMRPTLLLENDKAMRTAVQLRHRHVLVDEYQDVNRASVRLVKAIAGDGKRLWVVGDARQSIYRFRGASSANMAAFSRGLSRARHRPARRSATARPADRRAFTAFAPDMGASEGMLPLDLRPIAARARREPQIRRYRHARRRGRRHRRQRPRTGGGGRSAARPGGALPLERAPERDRRGARGARHSGSASRQPVRARRGPRSAGAA